MAYRTERELFFQGISLANIAALSATSGGGESFSQVGLWSINSSFTPKRTLRVDGTLTTVGELTQVVATLIMDLMKNR